jgi:HTH-type transcriptional regulator / antitoxin HigA
VNIILAKERSGYLFAGLVRIHNTPGFVRKEGNILFGTIKKLIMSPLTYKVIKSEKQYYAYCKIVHDLVFKKKNTREDRDIIDLLEVLIEHYDNEHDTLGEPNPVEMLQYLMEEHKIKSVDMAKTLKISKSLMSDILHYRRGMSKGVVRKLAQRFKMREEVFSQPYHLKPIKKKVKKKATAKRSKLVH